MVQSTSRSQSRIPRKSSMEEHFRRPCSQRRKHPHHAGHQAFKAEGTDCRAENHRMYPCHKARAEMQQGRNHGTLCRPCSFRRECGRTGSCLMEIFRQAVVRTVVGRGGHPCRPAECAIHDTSRKEQGTAESQKGQASETAR